MAIRATELEKITGFKFDKGWKPNIDLEHNVSPDPRRQVDGRYEPETGKILFPIYITYGLNVRHKNPGAVRLMDPKVIADDISFGKLADHELGHVLGDQVSRRAGLGIWFTSNYVDTLSAKQQLGLKLVSEGVAEYFEHFRELKNESSSNSLTGSLWLVSDILTKFGERGLVWLIANPFVPTDNIEHEAAAYRAKALTELSRQ